VRPGRRRRPPLEARSNWDPWLPLQEASPEVPAPLQAVIVLLLGLVLVGALVVLGTMLWP
jgi:hypothetical protein